MGSGQVLPLPQAGLPLHPQDETKSSLLLPTPPQVTSDTASGLWLFQRNPPTVHTSLSRRCTPLFTKGPSLPKRSSPWRLSCPTSEEIFVQVFCKPTARFLASQTSCARLDSKFPCFVLCCAAAMLQMPHTSPSLPSQGRTSNPSPRSGSRVWGGGGSGQMPCPFQLQIPLTCRVARATGPRPQPSAQNEMISGRSDP